MLSLQGMLQDVVPAGEIRAKNAKNDDVDGRSRVRRDLHYTQNISDLTDITIYTGSTGDKRDRGSFTYFNNHLFCQ